MRPILTADQIRRAEEAFWSRHPGVDLMGRAATAVAEVARRMLAGRGAEGAAAVAGGASGARPCVVVAAGQGNNAGDALFAAAELDAEVLVWAAADKTHPGGLKAALQAGARLVSRAEALDALDDAALVIDGVAGIGSRRGLADTVEKFADATRAAGVPVLSVDVPSGLAADRVTAGGAPSFRADRTVTFIAHKVCQLAAPAADRCGEVDLVDIGVDPEMGMGAGAGEEARANGTDGVGVGAGEHGGIWQVEPSDLAQWYPFPGSSSHKYSRGVVGLDTGSTDYPGAAFLGTAGALFTGCGMVRHAADREVVDRVINRYPSIVPGEGRVQAWVCGSGWPEADTKRLGKRLADGVPVVLDAGALLDLPSKLPSGSLLTPHAGELAKLLGVDRERVEADPINHARQAAARWRTTVLLKGATQYIAQSDGTVWLAVRGPAWTGQAGSGDVLAGACGALLASGMDAARAAALAASLQSLTASAHPGPWPPDRLVEHFPDIIASWTSTPDRPATQS